MNKNEFRQVVLLLAGVVGGARIVLSKQAAAPAAEAKAPAAEASEAPAADEAPAAQTDADLAASPQPAVQARAAKHGWQRTVSFFLFFFPQKMTIWVY